MGRSALSIPDVENLVEVSERKSDRSDQRHQTVRVEALAAVERCPRKRADAIGRACALRPVPGDDGGETLRTDAVRNVHLPVRAKPLEPIVLRSGTENQSKELDRFETPRKILELRGKLV